MARLLSEFDWTQTGVGPPDTWPPTLRAAVDLLLDSRFPMMLGWGPDFHLVYNDGYIPILGSKHPVVWETGAAVFGDAWPVVGALLEGVYASGEAVERTDQWIPLVRRDRVEDCWFSLSYSPVREASGAVVGLLSVATETTATVLRVRRDALLQRVGDAAGRHTNPEQALRQACDVLADDNPDVPAFMLLRCNATGDGQILSARRLTLNPTAAERCAGMLTAGWTLEAPEASLSEPRPIAEFPGLQHPDGSGEPGLLFAVPVRYAAESRQHRFGDVLAWLLLELPSSLPWDADQRDFCEHLAVRLGQVYTVAHQQKIRIDDVEARYAEIFEHAVDAITLGHPDGRITAVNPAAVRLLGWSEAELVAGGRDLVVDATDPSVQEGLRTRDATGEFSGLIRLLHRSGERIPCDLALRVYKDADGVARTITVFRDARGRQQVERQLQESQRMEAVARIAGGVAHDFNNLLTVIEAQISFLRDPLSEHPEALEDLKLLETTSRRAAALIRRLLEFSRRSFGAPQVFDPGHALRELTPLLRRVVGAGIELSLEIDATLPNLEMAPEHFEQILVNLVVNAKDAVGETEAAGEIAVALSAAAPASGGDSRQRLLLEVRDSGPGIPLTDRERVFDNFYTTKEHGTGIGLSTVRLLVEDAGGDIRIEDAPEGGCAFLVRLPGTTHSVEQSADPEMPTERAGQIAGRVLLVEDQAMLRRLLKRVLERAGHAVLEAANGEEALRTLGSAVPDLVVTDVVMPLMSGPELVRRLRRRTPDLPVILTSGFTGEDVLEIDMLSSVHFLVKPFRPEQLVEIADALIRDRRGITEGDS